MRWIERTHGIPFELVRHFMATMFDSEMFSARGQWGTVAVSAFALAVPAGLILLEAPTGRPRAVSTAAALAMAQTDRLSSLTLLLSITAILALLAWQALFPGRRDYMALAAMPVRSRQIFAARFMCVLLMAAAITALLILPVASSAPHAIKLAGDARWQPSSTAVARAGATAFGCLYVFFAIVGLQGLMINVLPARRLARWSGWTQGVLLGAALLAGLYSWFLPDWAPAAVPGLLRANAWAPPVWFLGLHEKLSGARDPFLLAMASRAVRATAGAVAFAVLMYVAAGVRFRRLLLEGGEAMGDSRLRERRMLRLLGRNARQEAILQFMGAVLARSRVHRLVLMGYAGAGLALMINSVLLAGQARAMGDTLKRTLDFIVLFWPLGFSFVFLPAVRHAFVMPAEWKANWIFLLTESQGRRDWMAAVERFVIACVIAPLHLATLPLAMAALGAGIALRMVTLQALVSLALFELLFYSWQQLPFTCSYVPGKSSLIAQLGTWLVLLCMVVPILARIVGALSVSTPIFLGYSTVFLAVWLWARRRRREGWGDARLIYEDRHGELADLGIRELSFGGVRAEMSDVEPGDVECGAAILPPCASRSSIPGVHAFPQEFRDSCGAEMMQAVEDAWQREGRLGRARILADVAIRVGVEHAAQLGRDIRYGLRSLAGSPGFTTVALVSLSLGICISTCAFSEMNGMVLRDLPGAVRPRELVALEMPASYPAYRRYGGRSDLFASTAAYVAAVPFGVRLNGRNERIWGQLVTASYFSTFGLSPARGRFLADDARTAVVSYRFWKEHLASDPGAVGRTLRINGQPVTILGVAPRDFPGANPTTPSDLWLPLPPDPNIVPALAGNALEHTELTVLTVVCRLQPWTTQAAAESGLDAVARQMERDTGDPNRDRPGRRITLVDGGKCLPLRKQDKPFFTSFFIVIAGLIMTIACANVANMMLARAAARRREIAVRLALGAGRGRIVRQLLTESLLVSLGAGAAGALASVWLMHLLGQLRMPTPIPVTYDIFQPDMGILLFTFLVAGATGLVFGLAPALAASRTGLTSALKEGGNVQLRRFRGFSLRNALMVSQLAGSLTLLVVIGFLSIGIQSTLGVQSGFRPENLWLVSLDPTRDGYSGAQSAAILRKLLDRVQTAPSVTAASLSVTVPVAMAGDQVTFSIPGVSNSPSAIHHAIRHIVGKDYFAATGIDILAGRAFRREDEAEGSAGVIVTQALAQEFWPHRDPLGRALEVANTEPVPTKMLPGSFDFRPVARSRATRVFEVVGIARDLSEGLVVTPKPRPAIYFPMHPVDYEQPSQQGVTLLVRAAPGVDAAALVRREIDLLDRNITPFYAGSMAAHIDEFMAPLRAAAWTYGVVGIFGLVLAAVGLAGMTAYSVASRNHEIGIRVALGAGRGSVIGLVMKEGAVLVAIGTAAGMAFAWAASRGLAAMSTTVGQVASTSASDPAVIYGAPLLLASLALVACYLPARKTLRVDPMVTLRQE